MIVQPESLRRSKTSQHERNDLFSPGQTTRSALHHDQGVCSGQERLALAFF